MNIYSKKIGFDTVDNEPSNFFPCFDISSNFDPPQGFNFHRAAPPLERAGRAIARDSVFHGVGDLQFRRT